MAERKILSTGRSMGLQSQMKRHLRKDRIVDSKLLVLCSIIENGEADFAECDASLTSSYEDSIKFRVHRGVTLWQKEVMISD